MATLRIKIISKSAQESTLDGMTRTEGLEDSAQSLASVTDTVKSLSNMQKISIFTTRFL